MAPPLRAITVFPSIAIMQGMRGPLIAEYGTALDRPVLFRFAVNNEEHDNDWTAIQGSGGGAGRWLDVPEVDKGEDLVDGNQTIYVGGKRCRTLPVATLTQDSALRLGTTNAREGHTILLTRLDVGAFTFTITDNGAATLAVMPVSARSWFLGYYTGTNWTHRASGLML